MGGQAADAARGDGVGDAFEGNLISGNRSEGIELIGNDNVVLADETNRPCCESFVVVFSVLATNAALRPMLEYTKPVVVETTSEAVTPTALNRVFGSSATYAVIYVPALTEVPEVHCCE